MWSSVIPGRREAASPESMLSVRGYGFRAPSLRSGPGMTQQTVAYTGLTRGRCLRTGWRMSLARDVTSVGAATLASRLLGFLRDMGVAAVLGAGPLADAYFAALQIPNLFRRLLADGALNTALAPAWLRLSAAGADRRSFAEQALGLMLLGLAVLAALCAVFAPAVVHVLAPGFSGERFDDAVLFLRLSLPYLVLAGLAAVIAGILNAQKKVAAAAAGVVVFNVILLAALALVLALGTGASRLSGDVLSISFVAAGAVQLLLVAAALRGSPDCPARIRLRPTPAVTQFFAQALPGVLAAGVPQFVLMAGALVASPSPAAVSWLYYANRLYELPLGVVSVAVASVLGPRVAASLLAQDRGAFADIQSRALQIALGLALPAALALIILAEPIVNVLFQRGAFDARDAAAVAGALAAMAAGLPGHVLEKVLGSVSFAHQDTRTPMWAALVGLASATVLAVLLFPKYAEVGVAAAIAVAGWAGAVILAVRLGRRGWLAVDRDVCGRLARIVLATLAMGVVVAAGNALLAPGSGASSLARAASLALLVLLGLLVYGLALRALGIARLRDALKDLARRMG
jgi:putative peptidoglycan lipid II flippase